MTSKDMRKNFLFMRNSAKDVGKYQFAQIKKQRINLSNIALVACSNTKNHELSKNINKGVHFFVDDYRFVGIYNNPERTIKKYSQYAFLLTPDFSVYSEMPLWRQIESVAMNRWVGAYWQSKGLKVIPTISWGLQPTFDFCFSGIEEGSIIAIGMVGCKRSKREFLAGYNEMLKKIKPSAIICLGDPFPEMTGNIIKVNYKRNGGGC